MCNKLRCFTVAGCSLILISVVLLLTFPIVFDSLLEKKLVVAPGTETFESFKSPPVPIYMQFWLFNVTNPQAVLNGSVPRLRQMGPYTYREYRLKYDIQFNSEIGTVSYKQSKTFVFEPELSEGNLESDMVTTINPVMMTLATKLEKVASMDVVKSIAQLLFMSFNEQPFITHSVGEFLFHGYDEPMLERLSALTGDPVHATGKFGFFYPKNGSDDGILEVFTGEKGFEQLQHIYEWKGQRQLDFWKTEYCNMINGTEGSLFPKVSKEKPIQFFVSELCRSLYALYEQDVLHGPLTLYRYVLAKDSVVMNDDTKCYCHEDFTCRSSMINVAPCRKGAPVVISIPHFYHGEKGDVEMVIGLSPNKLEHETYLDVEPKTGVVFRAAKRIQVNMPLRRHLQLPALGQVPEVILPVLWINESAVVPLDRTEKLHKKLTVPPAAVNYASYALVLVGIIFLIAAIVLFFVGRKEDKRALKPGIGYANPNSPSAKKGLVR